MTDTAKDIPTVNTREAAAMIRQQLGAAGWKEFPDTRAGLAHLNYEAGMWQTVRYDPGEGTPRLEWKMYGQDEGVDAYIDFGEQLPTLLSIITENAPQATVDNYRGIIAAVAKLLPAVYVHDDREPDSAPKKIVLKDWES